MDIFEPRELAGVVSNTAPPPAFLLNKFFREVDESTSEVIEFHTTNGRPRVTPFVSPLVAGKLISDSGFRVDSFTPAYVKDLRVFDPTKFFRRSLGETVGGNLTPEQRRLAALARAINEQVEMLTRRLELMAAEALFSGTQTIVGDHYPKRVVDFGRKSSLRKTLVGAARWGQSGVSPVDDLEAWGEEVFDESGKAPTDVILTKGAWGPLKEDAIKKGLLDTKIRNSGPATLNLGPVSVNGAGARLVGYIGDLSIWLYVDKYKDESGVKRDILPANSVLMASDAVEGVRHFGAIKDEEAGLQAMQYFVKSWVEKNPSVRQLLMQSAPLIVPYRTNATFAATVL